MTRRGIVVRLAVQQQQARLGGDRHADLVGDLEPAAALEGLLVRGTPGCGRAAPSGPRHGRRANSGNLCSTMARHACGNGAARSRAAPPLTQPEHALAPHAARRSSRRMIPDRPRRGQVRDSRDVPRFGRQGTRWTKRKPTDPVAGGGRLPRRGPRTRSLRAEDRSPRRPGPLRPRRTGRRSTARIGARTTRAVLLADAHCCGIAELRTSALNSSTHSSCSA